MTLPSMEEGMGADSALSRGGPCRAREGLGLLQEPLLLPAGQGRARLGPATQPVRGPRAWKEPVRGASQAKEAAKGRPPSVLPHHLPSVRPPPPPGLGPKTSHCPLASGWPQKICLLQLQGKREDPKAEGLGPERLGPRQEGAEGGIWGSPKGPGFKGQGGQQWASLIACHQAVGKS